jgi:uncharacterized protein
VAVLACLLAGGAAELTAVMDKIISFSSIDSMAAEIGAPARIVSGSPATRTVNLHEGEGGRLHSGRWHSSPGRWRVVYDEWEYCCIREGRGALTDDSGNRFEFVAGDSFIIQPGFTGLFDVIEALTKDYVILLPA